MDAVFYIQRGNEKWEQGDTQGAIADYKKAVETEPDNVLLRELFIAEKEENNLNQQ